MAARRPRATTASLLLLLSASSSSAPSPTAAFLLGPALLRTSPFLHRLSPQPHASAGRRRHLCTRPHTTTNMATPQSQSESESAGLADIGAQAQQQQKTPPPPPSASTADSDNHKPQWLGQLERALQRNNRDAHSRYLQLATVGEEDGVGLRPFVRTVVYRGVFQHEGRPCLKMITDARSEKIGHLATHPHAEVAWYFTKSREQFRVFGRLQVVTHADTDKTLQGQRKLQWGCLSDNAKVQFLWPHPGRPLPGRDTQSAADLDALFNPPIPEGAHKNPPDSFCLLLLHPVRIDHLELKASPQRRTLHAWKEEGEGQWVVEPVNP